MPRTCLACASPERKEIDRAIVAGEPLRNIAKRVSLSTAALFRHKDHVATAIIKAEERHQEKLGDSIFDQIKGLQAKALQLLSRMESDGDYRGAIVAAREARECLISLGAMLEKAQGSGPSEMVVRIVHIGGQPAVNAAPANQRSGASL